VWVNGCTVDRVDHDPVPPVVDPNQRTSRRDDTEVALQPARANVPQDDAETDGFTDHVLPTIGGQLQRHRLGQWSVAYLRPVVVDFASGDSAEHLWCEPEDCNGDHGATTL
jgi:hypothetical protein